MSSPKGPQLPVTDHPMLRQVTAAYMDGDRPTRQAFSPFPKDNGLLSTADGEKITAADAFKFSRDVKRLDSVATWGVTRKDCNDCSLLCWSDEEDGPPPDPYHAVIDFRGKPNPSQVSKAAKQLASKAKLLYAPPAENVAA